MDVWIAGAIFVAAYALIALERVDRTLVALIGALILVLLGIVKQEEAFAAIDLNVIFLLAGMMVIAAAVARTGFFEWLAIRSVRVSHGDPLRLLLILALVTAVLSAFLDNVTTVILITPITLSVARKLRISPVPYLIAQILASNIGGTATLIGDPPNILIGSAAGLQFDQFLFTLGPVAVIIFIAYAGLMALLFRGVLRVPSEQREAALEMTEASAISDRPLLAKLIVLVGLTIVGFFVAPTLGLQAATVALTGATLVMLIGRLDPHRALADVEWSTLFFFIGLFVLVAAIVKVGIVGGIGAWLEQAAGGDVGLASIGLLWFSAGASAVIDNIPYTAAAIPVVNHLVEVGMPGNPMWWSLALGACLGGNLTLIGASANVVVANIALREGRPILFFVFLRYGVLVTLVSLLISTAYIWLLFLR